MHVRFKMRNFLQSIRNEGEASACCDPHYCDYLVLAVFVAMYLLVPNQEAVFF